MTNVVEVWLYKWKSLNFKWYWWSSIIVIDNYPLQVSAAVTKVEISGTLRVVLHFTDEQPFLVPTKIVIMNFIILSLFNRNESYCDCQGAVQISFIDHPNLDYDLQVKIESTVVDNDDIKFSMYRTEA